MIIMVESLEPVASIWRALSINGCETLKKVRSSYTKTSRMNPLVETACSGMLQLKTFAKRIKELLKSKKK